MNNKIKRIENLKTVKKLQKIMLSHNLITEPSLQGGAQHLLEVVELDLRNNQLEELNSLYGFPNVSYIYLTVLIC